MASSSSPSRRLLFLAVSLCVPVSLVLGAPPICPRVGPTIQWLEDPDNCSKFYVCHGGRQFPFDCGDNVWVQEIKSCVGKGSEWDKCTISKELDDLINSCDNSNSAIFAKADNCAQYYDCSSQEVTVDLQDPHVVECTFPLLFNPDTKRCEHYDMVKCGDRPEPKDACEYEANKCRRAHCIPCMVRFPSCKGLPDGMNPWVGREYSPYYVLCQDERAIYHGRCDGSKGPQLFDPEKRMCVEMKPKKETP